jgi:transposase, IS30 family
MRNRRRTPKGGVQVEKQQQYLRLIAQGVNNAEVCRIAGVNRKTGNRWRYGRSVRNSAGVLVQYAPVKLTEAKVRSPRYLSEQERIVIADLLCAKLTVRGIARRLGRSPSTISRNSDLDGRYRPHHAEHAARVRAGKPRKRRIAIDVGLAEVVAALLAKRWSPEQVAHELRDLFVGQRERWLCVESIYQAIYDPAVALTRPARRRRRRRRLLGLPRRGRLTAMRMITERPPEAEDRLQAGHWEGDLIMGPGNRSAIGTLVERSTRFLILLPFPAAIATAEAVRQGIEAVLGCLPEHLRRTLTWDQGKELALHQLITAATGTDVFFCDAHAPWQRGSNENMNGLLRDYLPKGTDLSVHAAEDLSRIAAEVNDRPRKTLEWRRPADLFRIALASPNPTYGQPANPARLDAGSRQPSLQPTATTSGEGVERRPPLPVVVGDPQPVTYLPRQRQSPAVEITPTSPQTNRRGGPAKVGHAQPPDPPLTPRALGTLTRPRRSTRPSVATLTGIPNVAVGPVQSIVLS